MKNKKLYKEAILWIIMAIPLVYYFSIKSTLPAQVPIHFNVNGEPDRWTSPSGLLWLILAMELGVYALMLVIPLIDPKRKLQQMGNKYFMLKLVLVGLMSAMSGLIIYSAINKDFNTELVIIILLSAMFIIFGNYLPTVKPNYFIGIRTPWTLENEDNWKNTHRFTGWLWTLGGLVILIMGLLIPQEYFYLLVSLIVVLAFIPVGYSFVYFLKQKQQNNE